MYGSFLTTKKVFLNDLCDGDKPYLLYLCLVGLWTKWELGNWEIRFKIVTH